MDTNIEKLRTTGKDQKALFEQATLILKQEVPPPSPAPATAPAEKSPPPPSAVVRETFSMPPRDSELIDELRARAGRHGRLCFRSEIVRAALRSLAALDEVHMIAAVDAVERVEPGRKKVSG